MPPPTSRRAALLALLLLVPAPSIGVAVLTLIAPGAIGQLVWGISKVWLLAFPILWLLLVERGRITFPRPTSAGLGLAILSGLLIGIAIYAAYLLLAHHWVDAQTVRALVTKAGFATRSKFLALIIYTCLVNALLEEYVWRWFVTRQCERAIGAGDGQPLPGRHRFAAILLSALLFTIHHIIALAFYFDWRVATLGSIGVFLGGAIWSWFYLRYRSIWPGYASHVLADIAVMAIGWRIIFG